jgi:hypothetical protein
VQPLQRHPYALLHYSVVHQAGYIVTEIGFCKRPAAMIHSQKFALSPGCVCSETFHTRKPCLIDMLEFCRQPWPTAPLEATGENSRYQNVARSPQVRQFFVQMNLWLAIMVNCYLQHDLFVSPGARAGPLLALEFSQQRVPPIARRQNLSSNMGCQSLR